MDCYFVLFRFFMHDWQRKSSHLLTTTIPRHLNEVLTALSHLKATQRKEIIAEIAVSVDAGTPEMWVDAEDFTKAIEALEAHSCAAPLVRVLKAKVATLPATEDDE
jgi:hypothetical protein